jgi:hypothetical protein
VYEDKISSDAISQIRSRCAVVSDDRRCPIRRDPPEDPYLDESASSIYLLRERTQANTPRLAHFPISGFGSPGRDQDWRTLRWPRLRLGGSIGSHLHFGWAVEGGRAKKQSARSAIHVRSCAMRPPREAHSQDRTQAPESRFRWSGGSTRGNHANSPPGAATSVLLQVPQPFDEVRRMNRLGQQGKFKASCFALLQDVSDAGLSGNQQD